MPDSDFRDEFELDEHGRLRRKRVARDGERITFATISDHAAYGFSPTFSDGSPDYTNPHRPGFRIADNDDPNRRAAFDAYQERNRRKQAAWQRKGQPDEEGDPDGLAPPAKEESAWWRRQSLARKAAEATKGEDARQPTLDELRARADAAWAARNERRRNAWRTR